MKRVTVTVTVKRVTVTVKRVTVTEGGTGSSDVRWHRGMRASEDLPVYASPGLDVRPVGAPWPFVWAGGGRHVGDLAPVGR